MPLILNLPEEQEAALKAKAGAEGVSAEQWAGKILEKALASSGKAPLSDRIRDIWANVPESVRATLPVDGASQHDHYIYGIPKKEQ